MGLAILGIIVVVFFILAYLAARTWVVWHVVILSFLFLFSLVFMMFAAATLKVQDRWRGQYTKLTQEVEDEEDRNDKLTNGSILDEELGLKQLRAEATRAASDRGRVWRNLRLADVGENQLVFNTASWGDAGCATAAGGGEEDAFEEEAPAEDAAAGDGNAAAPPAPISLGLEPNAVVFAFKEAPMRVLPEPIQAALDSAELLEKDTQGFCKVPVFYMGEFKVVGDPNANPAALTLAATMPLSDSQIAQLDDANSTWVLYEIMPVDSHEVFAGATPEQVGALLALGAADPASVQQSLQEYVRDQQQANDNDPPERKWMEIEFTQAHSEEVDV
ncbi:MAG: hypothetical protein KDA92_20915, partial [Planctomycetales bacterium]|nr:hypothetical protein [Planctomycetales bacterium]